MIEVKLIVENHRQLKAVYSLLGNWSEEGELLFTPEKEKETCSQENLPDPTKEDEIEKETNSEKDVNGQEWDPEIHSANKTKNKDGSWRTKKGLKNNDDIPANEEQEGEDFEDTSSSEARVWPDAELSKLCNQAVPHLGGPQAIRDLIKKYLPEGVMVQSRNIPMEDREGFACALEKLANFQYEA